VPHPTGHARPAIGPAGCSSLAIPWHTVRRVYNIGAGNGVTNLDLTREILAAFGAGDEMIEFVSDRPGHDWHPWQDALRAFLIETVRWSPILEARLVQGAELLSGRTRLVEQRSERPTVHGDAGLTSVNGAGGRWRKLQTRLATGLPAIALGTAWVSTTIR
jgi:hypothetical protein